MESTALRNPEATPPARVIDIAVVSSVRKEEFCDRSKYRPTASQFSVKCRLEFVRHSPPLKPLTMWIRRVQL